MNLEYFDLEKFQKETGYEFKIAYDVFSSYYFHMFEVLTQVYLLKNLLIQDLCPNLSKN